MHPLPVSPAFPSPFLRFWPWFLFASFAAHVPAQAQSVYATPYYFLSLAGSGTAGSANGTGSAASFTNVHGIATDSAGNAYVSSGHAIRKISPRGEVTTFAGDPNISGSVNDTGTAARFENPSGIAIDAADFLYVSDTQNHTIRKISPTGVVTTLAGTPGVVGDTNDTGGAASFRVPGGLTVDNARNVYVADSGNNTIRKITSGGAVSTYAGRSRISGNTNGPALSALFAAPIGVAIDSTGTLYVVESRSHTVRKITPAGTVSTFAGQTSVSGSADGTGSAALFASPTGVAVDAANNVYVADSFNHLVRKITPNGSVTTLAGLVGVRDSVDGLGNAARFDSPLVIAVDRYENVFVGDRLYRIRRSLSAPVIIDSLNSATVKAGDTLWLRTLTRDKTPATFQWRRNGVTVQTTSTDFIYLYNVQASDAGTYTVVVTNPVGTTTSNMSTVNVIAPTGQSTYATPYHITNLSSVTKDPTTGLEVIVSPGKPTGIALDGSGNVYFSDSEASVIRKRTPAGVLSTVAGTANQAGSQNGTGAAARFRLPSGVAVDGSGNVYVADTGNHMIRKISSLGTVETVAGVAGGPGTINGPGATARFSSPQSVAVDPGGNVYVADTGNFVIRKISLGGVVSTLAGQAGVTGHINATGSAARFASPKGISVDSTGNVYVADGTTIRQVTPNGAVTTLAGQSGVDGKNDGSGTAATFNRPRALSVDGAGNVYVADTDNYLIRKITPAGVVTTLAGLGGNSGSTDGLGNQARFNQLLGIAADFAGNVFIADSGNSAIRRSVFLPTFTEQPRSRALAAGRNVTFTASGASDVPLAFQWRKNGTNIAGATTNTLALNNVQPADAGSYTLVITNAAGAITSNAAALVVDGVGAGSVYTAPYYFSTLAGNGTSGTANGTGSAAQFSSPNGIAVDLAGNVFVSDTSRHTIRRITPNGVVSTLAGSPNVTGTADGIGSTARFSTPRGLAIDHNGNLFVADSGNCAIRKINVSSGMVTTFAGSIGIPGSDEGTGTAASFGEVWGVAIDSAGYLYVADRGNRTIRKITPAGAVTTLAGLAGTGGSEDGLGSAARFGFPSALAVDARGDIFVTDQTNCTIRKITAAGLVSTFAGKAGEQGTADGTGTAARFKLPGGIVIDPNGTLFVSDSENFTIRKITSSGVVTTIAGLVGITGFTDGLGDDARFNEQAGLAIDRAGNIYVADRSNHAIRRSVFPPLFVTQPASQTAAAGANAIFTANVSSDVTLTLQWHRNGTAISGATTATLTLSNAQASDAGNYSLRATNIAGATTSNVATLSVTAATGGNPPLISSEPAGQNLPPGGTISLSISVSGTPPLNFQWFKDGEIIAGATTALLYRANAQPTDAGNYNVIVSNPGGAAVSNTAVVRVTVPPSIATAPVSQTAIAGSTTTLGVSVSGTGPFSFQWLKGGAVIAGATNSMLTFSPLQTTDAGSYSVTVSTPDGSATSAASILSVAPTSRLANVSVRTSMTTGQTVIVGIAVDGGSRDVLVRAIGPGLMAFGLSTAMADPRLELYRGPNLMFANDDWPGALSPTFGTVGAFALANGSRDAAFSQNLDGSFSIQARGTGPGVVLVEVYDLGTSNSPRLVNVSARNRVGAGDDILIAGFNVAGSGTKQVLIRAVGPGLSAFNVTGALMDPRLEVFDGNGTRVSENDNWAAALTPTFASVGAFTLASGSRDAALTVSLPVGTYTVQVRGVDGGTGEALVEVYELP
jgi:sugar lactone lactonase YvrE